MAGELSKKELESVLMQTMFAAKNVRAQHDRLLQLEVQLMQGKTDDDAARFGELFTGLVDTLRLGLEAGARYLTSCLDIAVEHGARLDLGPAFAGMSYEQLLDALLDLRLPASPTTQAEAFSRSEAAFYAVEAARLRLDVAAARSTQEDSAKIDRLDDPVPAASKNLMKIAFCVGRMSVCAELAVEHIDLAVAVLSSFLDPKQVASLSEFTDKHGII